MQYRSTDSAAKHLLRHLHNAAALRNNPLVAHIFSAPEEPADRKASARALERVHQLIIETATQVFRDPTQRGDVHNARQFDIVMRCDIGREMHKLAQRAMGLAASQFYRERRQARARLSRALEETIPVPITSAVRDIDLRPLALARVRALRNAGDRGAARHVALDTMRNSSSAEQHAEAALILCELFAEDGEFQPARSRLELVRLTATDDISRGRAACVHAGISLIEGRGADALRAGGEALTLFEAAPLSAKEGAEMSVTAHLSLALANHMIGDYDAGERRLNAARDLIDRFPHLPIWLQAEVALHSAGFQLALGGSRAAIQSQLFDVLAIANRNGLVRTSIQAILYMSQIGISEPDPAPALDAGRAALRFARALEGSAVYSWYLLSFAVTELATGNQSKAIELANEARAMNTSSVVACYADIIWAEAALKAGNAQAALDLSSSAIDYFRNANLSRLLANALRISSEAAWRLGQNTSARQAIREAMVLLDRVGSPSAVRKGKQVYLMLEGQSPVAPSNVGAAS